MRIYFGSISVFNRSGRTNSYTDYVLLDQFQFKSQESIWIFQAELRSKLDKMDWLDTSNKDAISRLAKRAHEKDLQSQSPSVSPVIKRTKPLKNENLRKISPKADPVKSTGESKASNSISLTRTPTESCDDFSDDDEFNDILASQMPVQRSSPKPPTQKPTPPPTQKDENDDFDDDSLFEDALQSQLS